MNEYEWEQGQVHSLCDHGRRGGHWVSRDYDHLDCKAVGCRYNRNEACMVPTRWKIGPDGRCEGFEVPPVQVSKPDGD